MPRNFVLPNVEDVFPSLTSSFDALKGLLQELSKTDALVFCFRVNHILSEYGTTAVEKQQNIARLFFPNDAIRRMLSSGGETRDFNTMMITTKGPMILLARWISMFCQDLEGDGKTFEDPGVCEKFAKAILMSNQFWLKKIDMQKMLDEVPLETARRNILSVFRQNAAGAHSNDQPQIVAMGVGYSMFKDPAYFAQFHEKFNEEFQQATGIAFSDYYISLTYFAAHLTNKVIDGRALFTYEQAIESVPDNFKETFTRFLDLETQTVDQMRESFWGNTESIDDWENAPPFNDRKIRARPIFKIGDGRMIVIDTDLFFEKVANGPLFTLLDYGTQNAKSFFGEFGAAFEKFVQDYLRGIYPSSPLADRLSCPFLREARSSEGRSMELADACLDYGTDLVLFEIKATFLNQEKILNNDNEKYIAMLTERYIRDNNGSPKGVTQLANTITELAAGSCSPVGRDITRVAKIYPVLLVHDELIDAPLHPYFFEKAFEDALQPDGRSGYYLKKGKFLVSPLTLMTFGDLQGLEFPLKQQGIQLKDMLEYYAQKSPDRLESFHNIFEGSPYQIYVTNSLARKGLMSISLTKEKLFPSSTADSNSQDK